MKHDCPIKATISAAITMAAAAAAPLLVEAEGQEGPSFVWNQLESIPFEPGLKGYYALREGGTYWLMGGSAFPVPSTKGGSKQYFDTIYQLTLDEGNTATWCKLDQRLPEPLAEGISVPVEGGSIIVGGHNQDRISDGVMRVSWSPRENGLEFTDLPSLPVPLYHPAAAVWQNRLFVAGGHDGRTGTKHFWRLDLQDPASGWQTLPPWPGPQRFGATLEVLCSEGREFLYLFSGGAASTRPRSQAHYLRDVYRFDPASGEWSRLADMPEAALIGVPAKLDASTLAIFSGSDGHDIERLDEIGADYRLPKHVQVYSSTDGTWSFANEMPIGLIGVPMLSADNGFILAGGEYSPGLRSAAAYFITPQQDPSNETR